MVQEIAVPPIPGHIPTLWLFCKRRVLQITAYRIMAGVFLFQTDVVNTMCGYKTIDKEVTAWKPFVPRSGAPFVPRNGAPFVPLMEGF